MITHLWNRHYHAGVTGSFHGDMARAFAAMLEDCELDASGRRKIRASIDVHMQIERSKSFTGRRWFCERFGTAIEKHGLTMEMINAL